MQRDSVRGNVCLRMLSGRLSQIRVGNPAVSNEPDVASFTARGHGAGSARAQAWAAGRFCSEAPALGIFKK